jgi:transcriptional regulator with XRE-family HTH domain
MGNLKSLFGKKVKEYRVNKKMTQSQLAEMVNVDNKHISCIESGKNFPSPDLIERIAAVFNVEVKDLFEFMYLQEPKNLKTEITTMLDKLDTEKLSFIYKYVRTFFIR